MSTRFQTGQVVYVEAVVTGADDDTVTVSFPASTDPQGLADSVDAIIAAAFVSHVRPEYDAPDVFTREKDQWTDPDDSLDDYYEGAMPWD